MITFIMTFILLLVLFFAMAIGYVINRKRLQGSCGGMANLGVKKMCDCAALCEQRNKPLHTRFKQ